MPIAITLVFILIIALSTCSMSLKKSMLFQKCSDYKASMVPTFARTEPPDTQVSIYYSSNLLQTFFLPIKNITYFNYIIEKALSSSFKNYVDFI